MKNKRILLVGGCGFIGHNLAIHLKKNDFEPIIIDSLSINNLNSINDDEIKNKHLYKSILETRIDLLKKNNIK
jgi:UDP-glucose 4-epimerase